MARFTRQPPRRSTARLGPSPDAPHASGGRRGPKATPATPSSLPRGRLTAPGSAAGSCPAAAGPPLPGRAGPGRPLLTPPRTGPQATLSAPSHRRSPPHLHAQQVLGQLRLHIPGHGGRRCPQAALDPRARVAAQAARRRRRSGRRRRRRRGSTLRVRGAAAGTGPCPQPGVTAGGGCGNNVKNNFPRQSRGVREVGRREIRLGMKW